MNARVTPTYCEACGLVDPFGDVQLYEHDELLICGACLEEAENDDEAEQLEPDNDTNLGLRR